MAVFDPCEQRLCIRVVYDGAPAAGKTTNLRQLAALFAAQRASRVVTPAEVNGRTLYFDWMEIAAGAVCGIPLLCQVVSAPGQEAFRARRQHLLRSADVVVMVCDSGRPVADAARALELIDEVVLEAAEPIPVVLQANKQDQPGAVGAELLRSELRRKNVHAVEAIATEGIGVVDTFVAAVRTAARAIQARVDLGVVRFDVRRAQNDRALLEALADQPLDKEAAAELLLEEAAAAMLVQHSADIGARIDVEMSRALEPAPTPSVEPPPVSEDVPKDSSWLTAPFPTADVPTGFVWPAHTGREILSRLALSGSASVPPDGYAAVFDGRRLSTTPRDHYVDADVARQALVRAARERTQLSSLLVRDSVLVMQPAPEGAWLWCVAPCTESIFAFLRQRSRDRTEKLASAFVDAVTTIARHSISLSPDLESFGVQGEAVRYVGSLLPVDESPPTAAWQFLVRALQNAERLGIDMTVLVESVARSLRTRLETNELAAVLAASSTGHVDLRLVDVMRRLSNAA